MRLVLDTNVLVAAFRSPRGASAAVLKAVRAGRETMLCNPPLFLEYEQTLKRPIHLAAAGLAEADVDTLLTALASLLVPVARGRNLRPQLPDPDDEMVFEAAVFGAADAIVTFEVSTFAAAGRRLMIEVLTPGVIFGRLSP